MRTSWWDVDPETRETEAVALLNSFPWETGATLIGGYAISAYGPPRYSEDVDLVLPFDQLASIEAWLSAEGYSQKMTLGSRQIRGSLPKLRIEKGSITGDLYFGGIRSRETGTRIQYEWLAESSRERILRLKSTSTSRPVALARPEVLWVLKLIAGRPQDLTDLFAINREPMDDSAVTEMLSRLRTPALAAKFERIEAKMSSEIEYADALSRRGLGSPESPRNRAEWSAFRARVALILSVAKRG